MIAFSLPGGASNASKPFPQRKRVMRHFTRPCGAFPANPLIAHSVHRATNARHGLPAIVALGTKEFV